VSRIRNVRLYDSLANPSAPLLRLFKTLERGGEGLSSPADPVVADPTVATQIKENRILSPDEVAELVGAYRCGAEINELARKYGVHRHTVGRHLEQAGVAKRPVVKMTTARVAKARELYEQGLSTNQIGHELHVNGSTVWKALKRAGVRMRPPVA
jgi:DNA invertase Pin-like site-specific DNA recombinase